MFFKRYHKIIYLILFGFILYFLTIDINYEIVKNAFNQIDLPFFYLALLFYAIKQFFLALRFYVQTKQYCLNEKTIFSFLIFEFKLLALELILPIPDSEDMFRYYFLKAKGLDKPNILFNLFKLRVIGVLSLGLLILLFSNFYIKILNLKDVYIYILLSIFILLTIILVFNKHLLKQTSKLKYFKSKLKEFKTSDNSKIKMLLVFSITMLHFITFAFVLFLVSKSFGINLPFYIFIGIVPILVLSFLFPLSYQSVGVSESVFYSILILLQVNINIAFTISLFYFLINLLFYAFGFCVLLFQKNTYIKN